MHDGTNGKPLTVRALTEAKRLPVEFLQGLGLSDIRRGLAIPYLATDGAGRSAGTSDLVATKDKDG
jgi:hypothetical protein